MFTGPKIITDGLVFGYDTGYPQVSSSVSSYKFNKGQPTTNLIPNIGTSVSGWAEYGWTGDFVISPTFENTFELTATNGWHNATYDTGITSGGTIHVGFEFKLKEHNSNSHSMFVLNGTHLGSYAHSLGGATTTFEWQRYDGEFTSNSESSKVLIGLRGQDSAGLTDVAYIRNLQVELKPTSTPFINGSRSVSGSLIDLTRTTDINVSNVSFDSNAQMTFDGTDDYIDLPNDLGYSTNSVSVFAWFKINGNSPDGGYHIICGPHQLEMSIHSSATYLRNGVSTSNGRYVSNNGSQTLNDGKYHYYGFTFDGSTKTAYIDGVAVGTQSVTGTLITSFSDRKVGAYGSSYHAHGDLPIYKVYNKVLTAAEIKEDYRSIKGRFNT